MSANLETARQAGRAAAALETLERQAAGERARQRSAEGLRHATWEAGQMVDRGRAALGHDPETALYLARTAATCVHRVDATALPEMLDKAYLGQTRAACDALDGEARARLHGHAAADVARLVEVESTLPLLRQYVAWRDAHERLAAVPTAMRWVGAYVGLLLLDALLQQFGRVGTVLGFAARLAMLVAVVLAVVTAVRGQRARSALQARFSDLGTQSGVQPAEGPGRRWTVVDSDRMTGELAAALAARGYDVASRPAADVARALATMEHEGHALYGAYPACTPSGPDRPAARTLTSRADCTGRRVLRRHAAAARLNVPVFGRPRPPARLPVGVVTDPATPCPAALRRPVPPHALHSDGRCVDHRRSGRVWRGQRERRPGQPHIPAVPPCRPAKSVDTGPMRNERTALAQFADTCSLPRWGGTRLLGLGTHVASTRTRRAADVMRTLS
ncbi:hypothetical protein tb265_25180 [Gemmatimonadetes bacterium T265]|nr:hypothetical protein tb265_25180 [Gemmatimonadetes bacterium T265]